MSRYNSFTVNGENKMVPFISVGERETDRFYTYYSGKKRLDQISYDNYGDSSYGWLIMLANPTLPSLEFLIPNETVLRIPFPLSSALSTYNLGVQNYITYQGL